MEVEGSFVLNSTLLMPHSTPTDTVELDWICKSPSVKADLNVDFSNFVVQFGRVFVNPVPMDIHVHVYVYRILAMSP